MVDAGKMLVTRRDPYIPRAAVIRVWLVGAEAISGGLWPLSRCGCGTVAISLVPGRLHTLWLMPEDAAVIRVWLVGAESYQWRRAGLVPISLLLGKATHTMDDIRKMLVAHEIHTYHELRDTSAVVRGRKLSVETFGCCSRSGCGTDAHIITAGRASFMYYG